MNIKSKIGDVYRTFTSDHRENGQFIRYPNVLESLEKCEFRSAVIFNYWMIRLQDAASPSSRLAICRQMIHENPIQDGKEKEAIPPGAA